MTPRLRIAAFAIPALLAAATVTTAADNRFKLKPGAAGKLCVQCHTGIEETLALPFVHTPVKSGDCADCHDPHASEHGKLLEAEPDAICGKCHDGMVPKDAKSTHAPAMQGQCVKCHDPHGSTQKANLRTSGSALCFDCHKDLGAAVQAASHKHGPVEKSCLTCHDPHASTASRALLEKPPPALCVGCHKPDQPIFAKKHLGFPVAAADCTSCHDPHGSSNDGILWASVHAPVSKGMCNQCHVGGTGAEALRTKRAGAELCRGCHNELHNAIQARNRVHWPVADGRACATCHSPHASPNGRLLRERQGELCGGCHRDAIRRQQASLVKHPPVAEGECATCHDPHASDATFLLAGKDEFEVCGTCHDWKAHSAHPIGEKVVDPRNRNLTLQCTSCHRTHGTPNAHMAHADPKQELCVQCHTSLTR
jgi:predicted CXXCH cytochrome family protein